ncbi:ATP-binding cassette domain-containing protein [Acidiphilium sp. AL]|uniref:ATP-binding cassette domain-containing protein n=1 Tax=Acidiphilium iwatense TaxID=768198 RepID=A0ABS9DZN0_9PROT|nr:MULTISPECIES: ATP-binding cassette domain-containing protein [Acidiphilium]MCF3948212.1 ATP-binding cassette domain-containing protein [Acidiphilium iwatense]MCU4161671.1 ATP-binding cassette domain-containing protein [Acidiphilium sp. AL]
MAPGAVIDDVRSAVRAGSSWSSPKLGSGIGFEDVTVSYGKLVVLASLSLTIEPGEIMALIGPSGSAKTTALRAVAGFVRPASGRIRIGERDVTDLPPHARDIGMVVQNYALFPHMRVEDNVAFGLRARREAKEAVKQRVAECLRMVGMSAYTQRYPRELSGGQQQRVAIARALAVRPRVLLLDEPLSALDAQIRHSMLQELARLHEAMPSLTVLYVTHDQTEALTLADRIAIMRDGRLVASGPSQALYREPPTRFAAEFLGRANLLPVTLEAADAGDGLARVRLGEISLLVKARPGLSVGRDCLLCIRPHGIAMRPGGRPSNELTGVVRAMQWQGDLHSVTLETQGVLIRMICAPLRDPPSLGVRFPIHFAAEDATLIPEDA